MPAIESVSVTLPPHIIDNSSLPEIAKIWLGKDKNLAEKFLRLASNSGVENRRLVMPYSEILKLGGLKERAVIFEEYGEALLKEAVEKCFSGSEHKAQEVSHLIFTSCSVPVIPSIDAKLILNSELSNEVKRVPIFQHGCVGGVVGLSLGCELAKQGKPVLVTSLEICSLVFQFEDTAGSQLVGASIFADGAASVLITPNEGILNFIDSISYLIPGSRDLMGYDLYDDGFHLRLDRELPSVLIKETPDIMRTFLARNGMQLEEVDYFLFHPGGRKILDFFEDKFNLKSAQCRWARDILRDYGNMSSSTIHFVMQRFLSEVTLQRGQTVLVMGIGPGLTLEFILLNA